MRRAAGSRHSVLRRMGSNFSTLSAPNTPASASIWTGAIGPSSIWTARCNRECSASSLFPTMVLYLPKLCDHLPSCDRYNLNEMSFRMLIVAQNSTRIALNRPSATFRLPELEYLLMIFIALANQLVRYKLTEANVSPYVQSAAGATSFVPPTLSSSLCANIT